MTNNVYYVKKLVSVFSGNSCIAASSFIIAAILISKTNMENYGYYILLQAIYQSWMVISKPLTWQALVKFKDEESENTLIKYSLKTEIYSSLMILFFLILLFDYLVTKVNNQNIILAIVFSSFIVNNGTLIGYLRKNSKFEIISYIQLIVSIQKIIICIFYYQDIEKLFIISIVMEAITWAIVFVLIFNVKIRKSKLLKSNNEKTVHFLDFIKFSYWGSFHSIIDLPVTQLDKIIISTISSLEITGQYNLIRRLASILGQIADPIFQVIFPKITLMVKNEEVEKIKEFGKKISYILLACGISILIFFNVTFELINIHAFNNEIKDIKSEIQVALLIQVVNIAFIWLHPLSVSLNQMANIAKIAITSNFVYILVLWLTIGNLGLWGGIISLSLQSGIIVLGKSFLINKLLKEKFNAST